MRTNIYCAAVNVGRKRMRWTYRVYYAGRFVAVFTSRKKAWEFMEGMTDFDLPFLITPDIAGQIPTMIGELK